MKNFTKINKEKLINLISQRSRANVHNVDADILFDLSPFFNFLIIAKAIFLSCLHVKTSSPSLEMSAFYSMKNSH